MEDKVQSALDEAQKLMQELGTDDGVVTSGSDGGKGGDDISFSIDSDDEEDMKEAAGSHPLLQRHKKDDDHPLQAQHSTLSASSSAPTTASDSTQVHSNVQQQQQQQQQHHHPLMPSTQPPASSSSKPTTRTMGTMEQQTVEDAPFFSSSSLSSATSPMGAVLGDAWKQQTSRFASAVTTLAQRAAHQVQAAAPTTRQQQQQPPPNFVVNSVSSVSSFGSSSAVITTKAPMSAPFLSQQQQQQQPLATSQLQQTASPILLPPELDNEQKTALIREHVGTLLPGERVIMFLANLTHVSDSSGFSYTYSPVAAAESTSIWCCVMTFYRFVLFGTNPFWPPSRPDDWNPACWPSRPVQLLQMPLASMERVEKTVFAAPSPTSGTTTNSLMGLHIAGKDNGRFLRFTTPSYADTVRAHEALQTYAFPGKRNLGYLFAFESKKDAVMKSIVVDPATGQKQVTLPPVEPRFSAVAEFNRQFQKFMGNCPWTLYHQINAQYQLCSSYPSLLAGPSVINDSNPESIRVMQGSAAFRSEQRLPVLTYAHASASGAGGGGSLWRASQPKIGLQGNRSAADEWLLSKVLEAAAQANQQTPRPPMPARQVLLQLTGSPSLEHFASNWWPSASAASGNELKILDLRPRSSAMANRTSGYGYENTSNYPGTTISFCGIGNIHAVRDAYQKVSNACLSAAQQDLQFASTMEDSKWLSHIRLILAASWETAYWIHIFRLPVLVHCSHGWDRTSQVAVLAQLLLDPYYRTIRGFSCLVEKDFMAFGHPFHTRCAHGVGTASGGGNFSNNAATNLNAANNGDNFDEGQVSPVFLQFLDCVYQLVALYPEAFEFDTRYLLDLSDHVYSCRFGNFLCDTERERETVAGIRQRTHSVWDFLETRHSTGSTAKKENILHSGVLLMPLPTLLRNVTLWSDRHAKYGPKPTQRWLPPSLEAVFASAGPCPPDARHDNDTPHNHRVPTLQESQAQLLQTTTPTPQQQSFQHSAALANDDDDDNYDDDDDNDNGAVVGFANTFFEGVKRPTETLNADPSLGDT